MKQQKPLHWDFYFSAWHDIDTIHRARSLGFSIESSQLMYNIVKVQAEAVILPMCAVNGIAIAVYFKAGIVTGEIFAN